MDSSDSQQRNDCGGPSSGSGSGQSQQQPQQHQQLGTGIFAPQPTPGAPVYAPFYTTDYHVGYSAMFAPLGQHHQLRQSSLAHYGQPAEPHQSSPLDYMVALAPTSGGGGQSCSLAATQFQPTRAEGMDLLRVLPPFPSSRGGAKMEELEEPSSDESQPGSGGGSKRRAGGVIRKGAQQQQCRQLGRHLLGIVPPNNSMPTPMCGGAEPRVICSPAAGLAPPPINPLETFCTVPGLSGQGNKLCDNSPFSGRLSLLSSTPKYRVTVGEIHRRINPPECLNASVLGGILRRAKSKDGGKSLRDQLKMYGLVLPAGRRKTANVSTLSALVEYEAYNLAKDFHALCENEFPAKQLADYLTFKSSVEPQRRKQMLTATRTVLGELVEVLRQDRSPVCQGNARPVLDHSIQQHLTHFSMVTHGFGTPAMMAALTALINWLNESEKNLQQQTPAGQQATGGK